MTLHHLSDMSHICCERCKKLSVVAFNKDFWNWKLEFYKIFFGKWTVIKMSSICSRQHMGRLRAGSDQISWHWETYNGETYQGTFRRDIAVDPVELAILQHQDQPLLVVFYHCDHWSLLLPMFQFHSAFVAISQLCHHWMISDECRMWHCLWSLGQVLCQGMCIPGQYIQSCSQEWDPWLSLITHCQVTVVTRRVMSLLTPLQLYTVHTHRSHRTGPRTGLAPAVYRVYTLMKELPVTQ